MSSEPWKLVGFSSTSPLFRRPISQTAPRRETPPTMANLLKDLLGGGSKSSASPIPSADSGMRARRSIDFLKPSKAFDKGST